MAPVAGTKYQTLQFEKINVPYKIGVDQNTLVFFELLFHLFETIN